MGRARGILTQDQNDTHQVPTIEKRVRKIVIGRFGRSGTHKNHKTAELPSAFLVSSTPSSMATGRSATEPTPMMIKITKSGPVLFALT